MNTNTSTESSGISGSLLLQFFKGFREQVDSPYNEWVTGEKVGHQPNKDEKLVHFVTHGGDRAYRQRFCQEHPELKLRVSVA